MRFAILSLLIVAAGCAELDECPDGWIEFDGSCYLFSSDRMNLAEADSHCEKNSAYLLHINNEDENDFIKRQMNARSGANWWHGISDEEEPGEWRYYGYDTLIQYEDWASGEPDDNDQHCAGFFESENFRWRDVDCDDNLKPICENYVEYIG